MQVYISFEKEKPRVLNLSKFCKKCDEIKQSLTDILWNMVEDLQPRGNKGQIVGDD